MLSPRGVSRRDEHNEVTDAGDDGRLCLNVCHSCHSAIPEVKNDHSQTRRKFLHGNYKPPKFAIANGFAIGQLPEHLRPMRYDVPADREAPGSSMAEIDLVKPMYIHAQMHVIRGKQTKEGVTGQRCLKGHTYSTKLDTAKIHDSILPRKLEDVPLRIILSSATGYRTGNAGKKITENARVRRAQVKELLDVLAEWNAPVYGSVTRCAERTAALPEDDPHPSVLVTITGDEDVTDAAKRVQHEASGKDDIGEDEINSSDSDIDSDSDGNCDEADPDNPVIKMITTTQVDPVQVQSSEILRKAAKARLAEEQTAQEQPTDDWTVKASNIFIPDWQSDYLTNAFPHLFPFGRGGMDEERQVRVSKEAALSHLMRLSTGAFHGYEFVLTAYDNVARSKASHKAWVVSSRTKSQGGGRNTEKQGAHFAKLDSSTISLLAAYAEKVNKAKKLDQPTPEPPESLRARLNDDNEFIKGIRACSTALPHTHEAACSARLDNYGYHYKFGKASLFFTLNENDGGSLIVHFLNGGNPADEIIPPLTVRTARLSHYPGTQALFHERVVQIIIEEILGWDPVHRRPYDKGGIFGHVKAFFACNEEQCRLSLHSHWLIWLHGHDNFLERMNDEDNRKTLEKYLEATIAASIPWPTKELQQKCNTCPQCNMPLVQSKEVMPDARRHRDKRRLKEDPRVLECCHCKVGNVNTGTVASVKFTTADRMKDTTKQAWENCDIEGNLPSGRTELQQMKWRLKGECPLARPLGQASDKDQPDQKKAALEQYLIVTQANMHDARHRHTCAQSLKAEITGDCRGGHPHDNIEQTEVSIVSRRPCQEEGCKDKVDGDEREIVADQTSWECMTPGCWQSDIADVRNDDFVNDIMIEDIPVQPTPAELLRPTEAGTLLQPVDEAGSTQPCAKKSGKETPPTCSDCGSSKAIHPKCTFCGAIRDIQSIAIDLKRDPASAWFNQCNVPIALAMECNNNVQYCKNCRVSFYCGMYGTKSSKENTEALADAVKEVLRCVRKEEMEDYQNEHSVVQGPSTELGDPPELMVKPPMLVGLRRLNAGWRGHTGSETIGGPRAALFCLNMLFAWMKSHDNTKVVPAAALALIQGQQLQSTCGSDGKTIIPNIVDFQFKHDDLKEWCLLSFTEEFERVNKKAIKTKSETYEFQDAHPLAKTHVMQRRKHEAVATIIGSRIENRRKLEAATEDDASMKDARRSYAQRALLLGVPWNCLSDLIGEEAAHGSADDIDNEWWPAFLRHRNNGRFTKRGEDFVNCAQEWFDGAIEDDVSAHGPASEGYHQELRKNKRRDGDDEEDTWNIDMDALTAEIDAQNQAELNSATSGEHGDGLLKSLQAMLPSETATEMSFPVRTPCDGCVDEDGQRCATCEYFHGINQQMEELQKSRKTKFSLEEHWAESATKDLPPLPKHGQSPANIKEIETVVQELARSTMEGWTAESFSHIYTKEERDNMEEYKKHHTLASRPSLKDVADWYTLEGPQREWFWHTGRAFLRGLAGRYADASQEISTLIKKVFAAADDGTAGDPHCATAKNGYFSVLTGEGGSGKTECIKAIVMLASMWGAGNALVVSGTSGIAACLINGCTYHIALNIGIERHNHSPPTQQFIDDWSGVVMMILDEMSMASCWAFNIIDKRMRVLKDKNVPFGGCSMVCAGDFCQLLPVKNENSPLFAVPCSKNLKDDEMAGAQLWQDSSERGVVHVLRTCYRQNNDLPWASDLGIIRDGNVQKELVDRLKRSEGDASTLSQEAGVLVATNELRPQIVRQRFLSRCFNTPKPDTTPRGWRSRGLLRIDSRVSPRNPKAPSKVLAVDEDPVLKAYVHSTLCKETSTHNMPGRLGIVRDHTYRITDNIVINKGMAKSMMVKVIDVIFDRPIDDAVSWDEAGQVHRVDASDVKLLVVEMTLGNWKGKRLIMEPKVFGALITRNKKKKPISMCQFELVDACCLTVHRVQGHSLPKGCLLVLHEDKNKCHSFLRPDWLYVALSRVLERKQLAIWGSLPSNPQWYEPEPLQRRELDRLSYLDAKTRLDSVQHFGATDVNTINNLAQDVAQKHRAFLKADRNWADKTNFGTRKARRAPKHVKRSSGQPKKTASVCGGGETLSTAAAATLVVGGLLVGTHLAANGSSKPQDASKPKDADKKQSRQKKDIQEEFSKLKCDLALLQTIIRMNKKSEQSEQTKALHNRIMCVQRRIDQLAQKFDGADGAGKNDRSRPSHLHGKVSAWYRITASAINDQTTNQELADQVNAYLQLERTRKPSTKQKTDNPSTKSTPSIVWWIKDLGLKQSDLRDLQSTSFLEDSIATAVATIVSRQFPQVLDDHSFQAPSVLFCGAKHVGWEQGKMNFQFHHMPAHWIVSTSAKRQETDAKERRVALYDSKVNNRGLNMIKDAKFMNDLHDLYGPGCVQAHFHQNQGATNLCLDFCVATVIELICGGNPDIGPNFDADVIRTWLRDSLSAGRFATRCKRVGSLPIPINSSSPASTSSSSTCLPSSSSSSPSSSSSSSSSAAESSASSAEVKYTPSSQYIFLYQILFTNRPLPISIPKRTLAWTAGR